MKRKSDTEMFFKFVNLLHSVGLFFNQHNIELILFSFYISDRHLIHIMCDALVDVHRGVIHLLADVNSK